MPKTSSSAVIYELLLRGRVTSAEYVAALRAEARDRVRSLRGAGRVTDRQKRWVRRVVPDPPIHTPGGGTLVTRSSLTTVAVPLGAGYRVHDGDMATPVACVRCGTIGVCVRVKGEWLCADHASDVREHTV